MTTNHPTQALLPRRLPARPRGRRTTVRRFILVAVVLGVLLALGAAYLAPSTPAAQAATTTFTFAAVADARVEEANPGTNYGTSPQLRVDGGSDPDVESYLRFTVTDLAGPLQSAKLRVYVYNGTVDGPAIYATSNTWSETGISWSNRPARTSGASDDKGAISPNSWVEYNVTPLVTGNGTYSFVLATSSGDGIDFYSREASSNPPQLVVTMENGAPSPTPTNAPIPSPTPTNPPGSTAYYVDSVNGIDANSGT